MTEQDLFEKDMHLVLRFHTYFLVRLFYSWVKSRQNTTVKCPTHSNLPHRVLFCQGDGMQNQQRAIELHWVHWRKMVRLVKYVTMINWKLWIAEYQPGNYKSYRSRKLIESTGFDANHSVQKSNQLTPEPSSWHPLSSNQSTLSKIKISCNLTWSFSLVGHSCNLYIFSGWGSKCRSGVRSSNWKTSLSWL